ncbi:ankyrin repeat domain-containing protein [Burkholderia sp. R-70006]|uniref:ankyrin repeat domain-containing protein n=1 Tax=Paraburkholderia domus TaxID=2793075 RepID=UPI001912277D|nr:ankyrin repeat domain-containing protein [Paraburkholderia domus]MBK5052868.1 ankyrin repeat domain-containing protein [Burkholderia sp. R-70006]
MQEFFDAMRPMGDSDAAAIGRALMQKHGLPAGLKDEFGRSALMWAIAADDLSFAVELINRGADVTEPDHGMLTPLHRARSAGAVHILMKAGAHIDSVSVKNQTPLMTAAINGPREVFGALLKYEPDLSVADNYDRLVSHHAVARDDDARAEITFRAYKAGADFDKADNDGQTARAHFLRQEKVRSLERAMADLEKIFGGHTEPAATASAVPAETIQAAADAAVAPVVTYYGSVTTEASERDFLASLGLTVAEYDYELGRFPVMAPASLTVDVTHYLTAVKYDFELLAHVESSVATGHEPLDSKARSAARAFLEYQIAACPDDEERRAGFRDQLKSLQNAPREDQSESDALTRADLVGMRIVEDEKGWTVKNAEGKIFLVDGEARAPLYFPSREEVISRCRNAGFHEVREDNVAGLPAGTLVGLQVHSGVEPAEPDLSPV